MNHDIILLNKKLTALTTYIKFNVNLNNRNQNRKILLALVEENKIDKNDLIKSFKIMSFLYYFGIYLMIK